MPSRISKKKGNAQSAPKTSSAALPASTSTSASASRPAPPQHNDSLRQDIAAQRKESGDHAGEEDDGGLDIADDLLAALDAREAAQEVRQQGGGAMSPSSSAANKLKGAGGKLLDGLMGHHHHTHHRSESGGADPEPSVSAAGTSSGAAPLSTIPSASSNASSSEKGGTHHHGLSSFFHSRTSPPSTTSSNLPPTFAPSSGGFGSTNPSAAPSGTGGRKPNRAKARLDRRAAASEALRQEAELELKANGGKPDQAALERRGIEELCLALGRTLHEVEPDGHCLYAAVADQLNLLGVGGADADASPVTYKDMRKAAAKVMRESPDDFKPFISDSDEKMAGIVNATAGSADNEKDQDRFYLAYCDAVESTGIWGGQPEILALSRAFERQINVVQVGYPTLKVGEEEFGGRSGGKGEQDAVFISYHRKMYGLGEHYNSLRKRT